MKVKILVDTDITFDDDAPDPEPDSLVAEQMRDSACEAVRNALDLVRNEIGFTHTMDVATSITIENCVTQQQAIAEAMPAPKWPWWADYDGTSATPVSDIVEVRMRDGRENTFFSQCYIWPHIGRAHDIMAYRIATGRRRQSVLKRHCPPEDGWFVHDGKSNPAPGKFVDACRRDWSRVTCIESENCVWSHDNPEDWSAIVFYRITPKDRPVIVSYTPGTDEPK